jgi:hypothetical protein
MRMTVIRHSRHNLAQLFGIASEMKHRFVAHQSGKNVNWASAAAELYREAFGLRELAPAVQTLRDKVCRNTCLARHFSGKD